MVPNNGHALWKLFGKGSDNLTSSNRPVINKFIKFDISKRECQKSVADRCGE